MGLSQKSLLEKTPHKQFRLWGVLLRDYFSRYMENSALLSGEV